MYALAVSTDGNTVYAGGQFTTIDAQTHNYLAALDSTSGSPTSWDPGAGDTVNGLAVSGPTVYAGGDFTSVGTQSNRGYAQFTAAPTNTSTPAISGTGVAGDVLTCGSGTWNDDNATYSYQWLRNGSAISGATSASYTATSDDIGSSIACQVTAISIGGSTTTTSNTITVTAAESSPGSTPPAVSAPITAAIENLTVKPSCYRARATRKASKKAKRARKSSRKKSRKKGRKSKRSRGKVLALSSLSFKFTLTQDATVKVSIKRKKKSKTRGNCPSSKKGKKGEAVPGMYIQVDSYTEFTKAGKNSASLSVSSKSKKKSRKSKKAGRKGRAKKARASTAFDKSGRSGKNTVDVASGLKVKNLKPGTYKAYVSVQDSAGNVVNEAAVKFWVLRR